MSAVQPSTRRRRLELGWYGVSALYSVLRIVLAKQFIEEYGLNVAGFALVEVVATFPYAIGTAKLVGALADREHRRALRWALIAGAGFLAPDLFILATTRHAPWWVYAIVGAWLVAAATLGTRKVRDEVSTRAASSR